MVSSNEPEVVCFASGTLIRTVHGDVAVEQFKIGDLVVTASGAPRPIKWLGHRPIDCQRASNRKAVLPLRIAAGAFGLGKPERDLFVSPGHAICVPAFDDVFIPTNALINGSTVARVEVDEVTYWHVELDTHDVLLANGLPAESYMDVGNRRFFMESETVALDALPDGERSKRFDEYRHPFFDHGPLVDVVRDRMRHRALVLGWSLDGDALAGLHLMADGERIEPDVSGLKARFLVPAAAKEVWIVSDTTVPYETGVGDDRRSLGVCIGAFEIDDGLDVGHAIALDDARLDAGFHAVENGIRWTNGRAKLAQDLWEGCRGSFFLRIDLAMGAPARWVSPEPTQEGSIEAQQAA